MKGRKSKRSLGPGKDFFDLIVPMSVYLKVSVSLLSISAM